MLLYQIVTYTIQAKIKKIITEIINLKYPLQHRIMNFNYLVDHILYQIFKIFLKQRNYLEALKTR